MESQVATLRLIASMAAIPVPQVYTYDTTTSNAIGAPYICMNFPTGKTLATAWFDTTLPTSLEDRHLRILTALSECLAQLARFSFPGIGSIHKGENGELTVGPCYDWKEEDGTSRVIMSGPYDTAAEYLRDHYAVTDDKQPVQGLGNDIYESGSPTPAFPRSI